MRAIGSKVDRLTVRERSVIHPHMSLGPIEQLRAEHARPVGLVDLERAELRQFLHETPVLALDVETDNFHAYQERICLIQLATERADWFFDPLEESLPPALMHELSRQDRTLILHAGDNDIRAFKRDFDLQLGRIFDTALAARVLGLPRTGLKDLLETELEVFIQKDEQRSDWSNRPLAAEQLRYARQDVQWLIPLYQKLRQRLEELGRLSWHEEECERARFAEPTAKSFDTEGWRKVKAAKTLGARGRSVMAAIWQWREEEAQRRNVPAFRVARPDVLARVAKVADAHGMKSPDKVRGFRFLPPNIDRSDLRLAVEKGLSSSDPGSQRPRKESPKKRAPWDNASRARLARLREGRDQWSSTLGLEPGFLLTNQQLERIARTAPRSWDELRHIEGLGTWRPTVLGQEIMDALSLCSP